MYYRRNTVPGADWHKEQDQQRSLFKEPKISLAGNTSKESLVKQTFY